VRCRAQRAASSETSLLACDVAGRNGKTRTERETQTPVKSRESRETLKEVCPLAAGLRVLLHSDEKRGG
jgi:hypothetical protein